jgi:hypothetical protein
MGSIAELFTATVDQLVNLRVTHAAAGRLEEAARVARALGYLSQARALAVPSSAEEMLPAEPGRHGTGEEE